MKNYIKPMATVVDIEMENVIAVSPGSSQGVMIDNGNTGSVGANGAGSASDDDFAAGYRSSLWE